MLVRSVQDGHTASLIALIDEAENSIVMVGGLPKSYWSLGSMPMVMLLRCWIVV